MALRTRLLVIAVLGLAVLAGGMAVVWMRAQPFREFDKEAYLEEMALRGKSLDKKPSVGEEAASGAVARAQMRAPVEEEIVGDHPRIELDLEDDTFDLGVLPNDKPATKEMPVRNVGTAPLEIHQLTSSCGCAVAELDDKSKTVPPGGQVMVQLTVDPKRIHGFEATKLVTIISNDPRNRMLKVKVHAKIKPEFELMPASLDFGTVEKGEVKKLTMRVRQVGEEPIELKDIELRKAGGELALSFEPVPEDQWQTAGRAEYLVKAELDTEAAPVGGYTGYFSLVTTCKRVPHLRCVVSGHIDSFFNVTPRAVPIYTARAGQNEAALIKVVGEEPITVEDLKVTGEEMTATATPGDDPKFVQVQLNISDDAKPGRKEERLSFKVKSDQQMARHSVRIYGNLIDRTARRRAHEVKIRHSSKPQRGVTVRPKAKPETPAPPASE